MRYKLYCIFFKLNNTIVETIRRLPSQSSGEKEIFSQKIPSNAVDNGCTDASKLVFCPPIILAADRYSVCVFTKFG